MGKKSDKGKRKAAKAELRIAEVETALKTALSREDRAVQGVAPVLKHMLGSAAQSLVSDAIVARLRGMLAHLATQLFVEQSGSANLEERFAQVDRISEILAGDTVVLSYCYGLAMEGYLAERLEQRSSVDPVLSPLLQELIASEDATTAELAMTALAAQARFIQTQRRMELPLHELSSELFNRVLLRWQSSFDNPGECEAAAEALKARYDESASRVGLFARLVSRMKSGAIAALELEHAGLALFASALALLIKQPRVLCVLACHEQQAARLALSLRAAGQVTQDIERQFALLEPREKLPEEIDALSPDRAAQVLTVSAIGAGQ